MLSTGTNDNDMAGAEREADPQAEAMDTQTVNHGRNPVIRVLLPAAWCVAGGLVGVAVALVLGWSALPMVLAALIVAGLSWLARGIGPLVATTMLWLAVLASWGIALFEYCLQVPANRIGYHTLSGYQLKTLQEVITLSVFIVFAEFYLGEGLKPKHLVGFVFLGLAVWTIFQDLYGQAW